PGSRARTAGRTRNGATSRISSGQPPPTAIPPGRSTGRDRPRRASAAPTGSDGGRDGSDMTDWTEIELSALRRAYASGTTRVSYDGKSVDYGSAEDLLARIRTIERAIAGVSRPLPVAGLAGFSRGDR